MKEPGVRMVTGPTATDLKFSRGNVASTYSPGVQITLCGGLLRSVIQLLSHTRSSVGKGEWDTSETDEHKWRWVGVDKSGCFGIYL